MDPQYQPAGEFYEKARGSDRIQFSRGHLVRRFDPSWGRTVADAKLGDEDTFHYTNAAPQFQTYNDIDWGNLEDYVLDRAQTFKRRCNLEMVELESLVDESEIWLVYGLIENHLRHTRSPLAQRIIDNWEHLVGSFVKVMPTDYRKVLQARRAQRLRPPAATPSRLRVVGGKEG